MAKILRLLVIVILVLVLVGAVFRQTICRTLITKAVYQATGLKLCIEDLSLDLLNSSLHLKGITLFNPPGFKDENLAQAKEILIKYSFLDSLKGLRLHLPLITANITEINIIRNKEKASNLAGFKKTAPLKDAARPQFSAVQKPIQENLTPRPKFVIERLELWLGKVTFMDYQASLGEPAVVIFTTDNPCVLKNVTNLDYVVNSVSVKGGFRKALSNLLARLYPDTFKSTGQAIKKRIGKLLPNYEQK